MSDLRAQLRDKFREIVNETLTARPEDHDVLRTPVGKFADAAADMIGALPSPPRYYPDEAQPVFSNALSQAEIEDGARFDHLSVHHNKETGRVVVVMSMGATGHMWAVPLSPEIADQFFYQGLAVGQHARQQAGN